MRLAYYGRLQINRFISWIDSVNESTDRPFDELKEFLSPSSLKSELVCKRYECKICGSVLNTFKWQKHTQNVRERKTRAHINRLNVITLKRIKYSVAQNQ